MAHNEVDALAEELCQQANLNVNNLHPTFRGMVLWLRYCQDVGRWADKQCNPARLSEYAAHCWSETCQRKRNSRNGYLASMIIRLAHLWVVWQVAPGDNSTDRRIVYTPVYEACMADIRASVVQKFAHLPWHRSRKATPLSNPKPKPKAAAKVKPAVDRRVDPAPTTCDATTSGTVFSFDPALMDIRWRVFSGRDEALLNCILMRRSSYCSLEMRLWHLVSLTTWLDAHTIRNGLTLGSLKLQRQGATALSPELHAIAIDSQNRTHAVPTAGAGNNNGSENDDDEYDDGCDFATHRGPSRGQAETHGHMRTSLLRHRSILQCPWNALAMLFYYKWHVLKEPPPDFSSRSWMDEPLFHTDSALRDDYLEPLCGSLYAEFLEAMGAGRQRHKYMTTHSRTEIVDALASSMLLRNTTSHARNLHVTRRALQNGHCAKIQLVNAGFHSPKKLEAATVPRHKYAVPSALERLIFPFADDLPDFDDCDLGGDGVDMRKSVAGFCSMLKTLRTVLLQDMVIMFDVAFYRRMLQPGAIMSSDIFQSMLFVAGSDYIRDSSWASDFLPLVDSIPHDTRLAQVAPCTGASEAESKGSLLLSDACRQRAPEEGSAKRRLDDGSVALSTAMAAEPKRRCMVGASDVPVANIQSGVVYPVQDMPASVSGVSLAVALALDKGARHGPEIVTVDSDGEDYIDECVAISTDEGNSCQDGGSATAGAVLRESSCSYLSMTAVDDSSRDEGAHFSTVQRLVCKSELADRLLKGIRGLSAEMQLAAATNDSILRKFGRIVYRQALAEKNAGTSSACPPEDAAAGCVPESKMMDRLQRVGRAVERNHGRVESMAELLSWMLSDADSVLGPPPAQHIPATAPPPDNN